MPLIVRDIPVYEKWLTHNENCYKARNNKEFLSLIKEIVGGKRKITEKVIENGYRFAKNRDLKN